MRSILFKLLACVASGALWFLACADFDIWPLAWFAYLPLFIALRSVAPRRAFLWGWLTGFVANAGGFYWITLLLMRFGHMHWVPALLLFIALAAYQGLHFGAFAYLYRKVQTRTDAVPMTLMAPVMMTAVELVMPFIFPWYLAITQAWVVPVIQVAELAGPLGVTFLLVMVNGMIFDLVQARRARRPLPLKPLVAGAAVLVAALAFGYVRIHQVQARRAAAPKVKIGVVQANIGIVEKGRARLADKHMQIHLQTSRELVSRGAELLLWPESSYPFMFFRDMQRDWPEGHRYQVMRGLGVPLIFGSITYARGEEHPYNSAFMMTPDGRITGRFDKNYLLVFGEYIPFYEYIPQFKDWFPAAAHFSRGTELTTFQFRDWQIGPLICYEDIIPSFGRRLARLEPNLLVNLTNDAWFGSTSEPWEHLALAVYRSVETRLDLVRAVNTGVSAVVDATGAVREHTQSYDPVVTPGVPPVGMLGEVAMMQSARTLYVLLGDWLGYVCLLGVGVLLLWSRRRVRAPAAVESSKGKKRRKKRG